MKIYSRYARGPVVFAETQGECQVQQHMANEVDINQIMERYQMTGVVEQRSGGQYIDVSEIPDLAIIHEKILEAQVWFDSLPSQIRDEMGHDWRNAASWMTDPKNLPTAKKYGLWEEGTVTPLDVTVPTDTKETTKEGETEDA